MSNLVHHSLSHISHYTQRHASSHTVYHRQCLHSIIFHITPNVMQAHTHFTTDSAFTQSYFSSQPTSFNLTHRLPQTVPSLNHISHHTQRHASSHTVYHRQRLHSIIFLITLNVMQAHTMFTTDSAFTQFYFSSVKIYALKNKFSSQKFYYNQDVKTKL